MSSAKPNMTGAVRRWQRLAREHPGRVDLLFAILVATASLADVASVNGTHEGRDADWYEVALVLLGSGSLIWRRRVPVTVLGITAAAMCVSYSREYGSFLAIIGVSAIYSVTVHSENRRRACVAIGAACVALIGVASSTVLERGGEFSIGNAASMAIYLAAAVVVGLLARNWNQLFVDTEQRAKEAEADRLVEAERAVARERSRIAREMHDVVAHGMSVISVQAAAGQEIARSDPERTIEILANIEATGRESLTEMRRMLGVIRGDDAPSTRERSGSLSPQPSLNDVDTAIAHCVEAGVAIELVVAGHARPLPPGVELAGFRIVQEALTNVLKHAGSSASATVEVRYSSDDLELTISDTGRGAVAGPSESGSGNGIIGMRERVDAYGGNFRAGPKPSGGYEVRALLPIEPNRERPVVASADAPDREQPA